MNDFFKTNAVPGIVTRREACSTKRHEAWAFTELTLSALNQTNVRLFLQFPPLCSSCRPALKPSRAILTESLVISKTQTSHRAEYVATENSP